MPPHNNYASTGEESGSESDSGTSAGSRSRSQSPAGSHNKQSPNRRESPTGSNRSARSNESPNRSQTNSPQSRRSRSGSRDSARSGSAESHKSASASPSGSRKSKSRSPADKSQSGSPSERHSKSRSRSGTPRSGTQSPKSRPESVKSRSGSPQSRSQSPRSRTPSQSSRKSKSRSKSKESQKSHKSQIAHDSRSNTPDLQIDDRRSRSGSRSSHHSSASVKSPVGKKIKKRAVLSDSEESDKEKEKGSPKRKVEDSNSENENENKTTTKKKQKNLIDSDSDENQEGEKNDTVTADALFGDASDISSEDEEKGSPKQKSISPRRDSGSEKLSDREDPGSDARRSGDEDEQPHQEPEPEPEPLVETRINADIPKITTDLGKELHFVKLPNFLSVETRPFDQETYEDEIDEEETLDEEGRARLKLKVENTIRWRTDFNRQGDLIKESNARFVKWSDGSMSLHLGDEIFDVYKQPLHGDYNHLFVRQGSGLLGQAVFRTKLTFRPHSTESFTHRKMTLSLADRSQKTSGIKILSQVGVDPDQDRQYQLKKEEQELRASIRAKGTGGRSTGRRNSRAVDGAARRAGGDDASDDEGAISLQAIKNKYKSGQQHKPAGGQIYSSDEEASDVEARRAKRLDRAKVLQDSEDEGSGSGGGTPKRSSRSRSKSATPEGSHHSGSESE